MKEKYREESFYYQNENDFDYYGIQRAFYDGEMNENGTRCFKLRRILVIQMK